MRIPNRLTCLLRNLYVSQEATVGTCHGTSSKIECFKIGKGVQGCILSPCSLIYMQSTSCEMLGWMKHKRIKIAGRNINSLRYADDTTLMAAESEELESLEEGERGE